jgi:hypothetical protein
MSLAVLADHMASKGRGPDSMLIHMSPREVQGLQALAENQGGSLTINPETGLPEAGFLDKLLPTIIGAGLSMIPGVGPLMAAGIVGGIQTIRTGDIGKGLAAGLGAYGGAGLAQGLATAGTGALSAEVGGEALKAAGLTGEAALTAEADQVAQRAIGEKLATATPYETLSAGASKVASSPESLGQFAKTNAKNLMYAAGPAILAGENVQAKGPQTVTKPGMIRPYSFDPYGGTYTAGIPYEAQPTRAAGGGLMGMNDGGYSPGQLNFAERSEPVVRMAEGGIAGYAGNEGSLVGGGGDAALAAYQAGNYGEASRLLGEAGMSAQDVVSKYGLDQAQAADVAKNLAYTGDMSGIAYGTGYVEPAATPTYTQYTPEQMGSYLTTNPDVDLATAIKTTNADPTAVNRYIASLANPFVGSTDTTGGSGTLGIFNQLIAQGIDPTEYYNAAIANDPKYAGWSLEDIQRGYNLDKGAYALSSQLKGNVADKDWVKFMDANKYSINDAAQAFGLSRNEVQRRYDAVKAAEKRPPLLPPKPPVVPSVVPGGTYGRPDGTTPGDVTTNPDGSVTIHPNIPYRPDGGFSGIGEVRDAWEAGGGSLGYLSPTYTREQFKELYEDKLTGGSKQSYDYLRGNAEYDPTPYTPTGEIQKPYWESVGRFPVNLTTKKYLFKDGRYVLNPDYVEPPYVLAAKKATALTNQDKEPTDSPGAGNKWVWNSTDKKWEAKPISATSDAGGTSTNDRESGGAAAGGLMAMAGGGMSQQFDLGGYSDGGRLLRGPGDGVSDSIPATIGNKRPARLADGEFVVPARIVSELGNGSTEAGARKLYAMMDRVQSARRRSIGKGKVAKNSRSDRYLPA